jgi:hypothetical protein
MNVKSLLTNPYLIFWSILFIEFWVFMWVFVFGGDFALIPGDAERQAQAGENHRQRRRQQPLLVSQRKHLQQRRRQNSPSA